MKMCSYCGRENTDDALHCKECGTEFEREAAKFDDKGLNDEVKTVTIRTFTSHDGANITRSNLEAHGIQCWINSDDGGGAMPYLTAPGGVRLLVRVSDAEVAVALLNAQASLAETNKLEIKTATVAPPETVSQKKLAWGQIICSIVLGVILCLIYQWGSQLGIKTYYQYTRDGKCSGLWVYNNSEPVEFSQDNNFDGKWDFWIHYKHGQTERTEADNNFDGKPDEFSTFYEGSPLTQERDADFNGIPDEFYTYKNGVLQQSEIRPNSQKFATQRWIYQNGVLIKILRVANGIGGFGEEVLYDPFFNPISTNTTFQLLMPSSK